MADKAKAKPVLDTTKTKEIQPVAKGKKCVVINTQPRAIQLAGVELLIPGRNIRPTAAVTQAMRNPHARNLSIRIEELGDPEKESEGVKIAHVKETYNIEVLEEMQKTEDNANVLAAISKQLKLIAKPKPQEDE